MSNTSFWTIADWQLAYQQGAAPADLLSDLLAGLEPSDVAWISRLSAAGLQARLEQLSQQLKAVGADLTKLPLYGVPFAVKDNIDVAGLPTTCACPAFSYQPASNAGVIERLEAAGAVVLGKTNLDQFATGLVGTRSPYGAVPNAFKPEYISGGSSSGSAWVVAKGLVPFALGTDTAGSGRVPAGHNNLVGLKPTRGLFSKRGLVAACRTLDCISVLSLNVDDAALVMRIMQGFDFDDADSRQAPSRPAVWPDKPVLGVVDQPEWFGDAPAQQAYEAALQRLQALGVELRPIDFAPLFEVAALLYDGPWVAERYAAIEQFMNHQPQALHPVVRSIIDQAKNFDAVAAYKGEYRRLELARQVQALTKDLDGLLVPTAPSIYTIEQVLAEPVLLNSRMGRYTNFVNLLDWCAIALPAGMRVDGLPAGITLIAPAWHEAALLEFARCWQLAAPWQRGASNQALPAPAKSAPSLDGQVVLAVVGAHLSGLPLNGQLLERGAKLLETSRTSANYRLYALPGTIPPKPGLLRTGAGAPIEVELWAMPLEHYGSFVALIGAPLGIGSLELQDGRVVQGFICEAWAVQAATDITAFGGWRAFLASQTQ